VTVTPRAHHSSSRANLLTYSRFDCHGTISFEMNSDAETVIVFSTLPVRRNLSAGPAIIIYDLTATPMFARQKSRPERTLFASGLPESSVSPLKPRIEAPRS
jgi:hypothetical protein